MKHKKHLLIALMTVLATGASAQTAAARFDMSVKDYRTSIGNGICRSIGTARMHIIGNRRTGASF